MPLALLAALTGCTDRPAADGRPATATGGPAAPVWQPVALPGPGPDQRTIRDLVSCAAGWYAVGAAHDSTGATAPLAWSSVDGQHFHLVPTKPVSAYGPEHELRAAACAGDRLAVVGGTAGGVHGNPRLGTWLRAGSGPLTEIPAGLELYGGPDAIGVGRIAAGPAGFVIVGAWRDANGSAGAADWYAADGRDFQRVDADPALESDRRGQVAAQDVLAGPDGFTLVGSVAPSGAPRTPVAWTSPDGQHWQRVPVPGTGVDAEPQRVVAVPGGLLAVGLRGTGFGVWRRDAGGWRAVGGFGTTAGSGLPRVTGLASAGDRLVAVVADGTRYRLWLSRDGSSWREAALPVLVPATGQHLVTVAARGAELLLAADGALYRG